jgi:hypothetical protein
MSGSIVTSLTMLNMFVGLPMKPVIISSRYTPMCVRVCCACSIRVHIKVELLTIYCTDILGIMTRYDAGYYLMQVTGRDVPSGLSIGDQSSGKQKFALAVSGSGLSAVHMVCVCVCVCVDFSTHIVKC